MSISCPTCEEVMATPAGLTFHLKYSLCRHQCNYCQRKFRTKVEASNHQEEIHPDSVVEAANHQEEIDLQSIPDNIINKKSHSDQVVKMKGSSIEEKVQKIPHGGKVFNLEGISTVEDTPKVINSIAIKDNKSLKIECKIISEEINQHNQVLSMENQKESVKINQMASTVDYIKESQRQSPKELDKSMEIDDSSVEVKNPKESVDTGDISKVIQRQSTKELEESMEIDVSEIGVKIQKESVDTRDISKVIQRQPILDYESMELMEMDNLAVTDIVQEMQSPREQRQEESTKTDASSVAEEIIQEILNTMKNWDIPVEVEDRSRSCLNIETKDEYENWKQDPLLPEGWKVFSTTCGGKCHEMFLSPNGQVFKSRDNVIKSLKKEGNFSRCELTTDVVSKALLPDIKYVGYSKTDNRKKYKKLVGSNKEVDQSDKSKDLKSRELRNNDHWESSPKLSKEKAKSSQKDTNAKKDENAKTKKNLKKNWIEDDPSVPPGWKIRKDGESETHFMSRKDTNKESFLSPSGIFFSSRKAVLDHLLKDGNASLKDVDIVEIAMGKVTSEWIEKSNNPSGWKSRKVRGKEMFKSLTGEMFLGRVAVLQHLVATGASVEEIVRVEKGIKGTILIWRGDTDLPHGWTVRAVYGLNGSRENSLFKSPSGEIYGGNHILKIMEENKSEGSVFTTFVENTRVSVTTLDDTLAAMLEPIVDIKELPMTEWSNLNEFNGAISSVYGDKNTDTAQDDDSDAISLSDDEVEEIFENESYPITSFSNVTNVTNVFSKETRKVASLSEQQLEILEMAYGQWSDPFDELVDELVKETGLQVEDVKNWFQVKTADEISQAFIRIESCQKDGPEENEVKAICQKENGFNGTKTSIYADPVKEKTKEAKKGGGKHPPDALKLLRTSFKSNPVAPKGDRLENLIEETGLTKLAIKRWFYKMKYEIGKDGGQEVTKQNFKVKSEKSSINRKAGKSSRKANKCDWNQDPTLPPNWTFGWINGNIVFQSPEGEMYQSRIQVIKHLQSVDKSSA